MTLKPLVPADEDFGKPETYLFVAKTNKGLETMSQKELAEYSEDLKAQWERVWFVIKWAKNMAKEERARELEPLLQKEMLRVGRLTDKPYPEPKPWVAPSKGIRN